MIKYTPFWKTMRERGETTYSLIKKHHIGNGTLYRMRKNRPITTTTIDDLCRALNCGVEDVLVYEPNDTAKL